MRLFVFLMLLLPGDIVKAYFLCTLTVYEVAPALVNGALSRPLVPNFDHLRPVRGSGVLRPCEGAFERFASI